MFINSTNDRMIVILEYNRVFLYKNSAPADQKEIKWELIRSFDEYPFNLETGYQEPKPRGFTKDFKYFLVYSNKTQSFSIQESDTGKVFAVIPKEILSVDVGQEVLHAFFRFSWVDNSKFMVVDTEGHERLFEVNINGFREVSFNYRPLFNEISGEEWKEYPYYLQRSDLKENTLGRLQRVYQTYKTDRYLLGKTKPKEFYQNLITVDRNNIKVFEHSFTFLHWSIME